MSVEKMLEEVSNMNSKEQIELLLVEVDKAMKEKQNQITMLQGEIRGYANVKRLMGAFVNQTKSEGVLEVEKEEVLEVTETPKENKIEEERKKRLLDGKCTFKSKKSDGGKWCRRTLKTKEEKELGYCKVHIDSLNLKQKG